MESKLFIKCHFEWFHKIEKHIEEIIGKAWKQMYSTNSKANRDTIHMMIDFITLVVIVGVTMIIWGDELYDASKLGSFLVMVTIHAFIFYLVIDQEQIYDMTLFFYRDRIWKKVMKAFCVSTIALGLLYYFVSDKTLNLYALGTFLGMEFACSNLTVFVFQGMIDKLIRRRNVPRTAYIGSKDSYNKFRYFMGKTTMLHNDIGYISVEDKPEQFGYIGCLKDLDKIIKEYNIDQIYFLHKRDMDIEMVQKAVDTCILMGVPCRVVVDVYKRRRAHSYVSTVGTYPVVTYHTTSMNPYQAVIKRCADIIVALIAIILTSPIMLITAIAIKIDSRGPVLFRQVRVGKNGRHFRIWKFRSMYMDAEKRKAELMAQNEMQGLMFKMKDDPRITKVGKIIRKLSIDELPQFFNVLFGSMSVVGTRPPTLDEVDQYQNDQWRRICIKPGITGMWQVSGRSKITSFDEVVRLDLEYIDSWRLMSDVKIFFKTFAVLFEHDDAY